MEIRTLTPADAAAYWSIRLEALHQEPAAFGSDAGEFAQTTVEQAADRIRSLEPPSFLLGCFDQATLVGTACFTREAGRKERHKGHINGVYLAAAYRGQGLGRALLSNLLERAAADASLEQCTLSVSTCQHAAYKLYQQLGFASYGIEPRAVKIDESYIDEHKMLLLLRQPDGSTAR